MKHLKVYTKQDVLAQTTVRRFETKIGERIQVVKDAKELEESLHNSNARYVILGVSEFLGSKANLANGDSASIWLPFLKSFSASITTSVICTSHCLRARVSPK